MLDQEEHSAETENGERGEVIKGRTELGREMGRVQNRRRGEAVKEVESRLGKKKRGQEKRRGRSSSPLIPYFLFPFLMSSADL